MSLAALPAWAYVVAAAAALALAGGFALKRMLLSVVPTEVDFVAVDPARYPLADLRALAGYTALYEQLGFVPVGDYTLTATSGKVQPGFARLFVHPETGCYAEVNQLFPAGRPPTPLRSVIGTLFDDGWSLATTDREVDAVTYAMRRPRGPWTSLPGRPPAELLDHHLAFRDRLVRGLGLRPRWNTSQSAYFAYEREQAVERRRTLARRNIFVFLAEVIRHSNGPPSEWLGDYTIVYNPSRITR
jgi:hypothetical protein